MEHVRRWHPVCDTGASEAHSLKLQLDVFQVMLSHVHVFFSYREGVHVLPFPAFRCQLPSSSPVVPRESVKFSRRFIVKMHTMANDGGLSRERFFLQNPKKNAGKRTGGLSTSPAKRAQMQVISTVPHLFGFRARFPQARDRSMAQAIRLARARPGFGWSGS